MRHRLIDLMRGQTVLSGALAGRKLLSGLIAETPSSDTPTPAFLDFTRIDVATTSFLREAVIGFRDYARQSLPMSTPSSPIPAGRCRRARVLRPRPRRRALELRT